MVTLFSILGSLFSLGGNLLIIKKQKVGWLIWIAGNIAWILVNLFGEFNAPMVLMYIVYLFINLKGFIDWKNGKY
jgi:nicotinamide riboside transporter PnuC